LQDSRSSIDIPLYEPGDLEDRYETRLRTLIDAKLKGEGIDLEEEAPQVAASNVVDLMAALKKSLGQEKLDAAPKQKKARAAEDARQPPGLKLPIKGRRTAGDEKVAARTATKSSRKRA
jgi:DNA end-binding protein Ku